MAEIWKAEEALKGILPHVTVCGVPLGYAIDKNLLNMTWEIIIHLKIPNLWKPGGEIHILESPPVDLTFANPTAAQPPPVIKGIAVDHWTLHVTISEHDMVSEHYSDIQSHLFHKLKVEIGDFLAQQVKIMGL